MRKTVLVTGSFLVPDDVVRYLHHEGFHVRRIRKDTFTNAELTSLLEGVSGYLIGGYEEPTGEVIASGNSLEAVAFVGTDYKAYFPGWRRAMELGISVLNSPGANAVSVAEYTIHLLLRMCRPALLPGSDGQVGVEPGTELEGCRLGIIGLGRVGARVARIARLGFGMDVGYHSRTRRRELEEELDVRWVPRRELIQTSTALTLHRPGVQQGEPPEMLDSDLSWMPEGAILINTGHVGLVDLDSLHHHILERGLKAAFDGLGSGEDWNRLMALGSHRFFAGPQSGFHTSAANTRAALMAAKRIRAVLRR